MRIDRESEINNRLNFDFFVCFFEFQLVASFFSLFLNKIRLSDKFC